VRGLANVPSDTKIWIIIAFVSSIHSDRKDKGADPCPTTSEKRCGAIFLCISRHGGKNMPNELAKKIKCQWCHRDIFVPVDQGLNTGIDKEVYCPYCGQYTKTG